jgi:hypothetical protein
VVQQDASSDGPELIVLEGRLVRAVVNLAPAFFENIPVGYLCGEWETTGGPWPRLRGEITGMFQLPFAIPPSVPPSYVVDPTYFAPFDYALCCEPISDAELRSAMHRQEKVCVVTGVCSRPSPRA